MYQWETGSKVSSPYLKSKLIFSNSVTYKIKRNRWTRKSLVWPRFDLNALSIDQYTAVLGRHENKKIIIIVRYLVEQYCFTKYKMVLVGFKPAEISLGMIPIKMYHFAVSIKGFHMKKSFFIENMPFFKLQSIIFYEWIY